MVDPSQRNARSEWRLSWQPVASDRRAPGPVAAERSIPNTRQHPPRTTKDQIQVDPARPRRNRAVPDRTRVIRCAAPPAAPRVSPPARRGTATHADARSTAQRPPQPASPARHPLPDPDQRQGEPPLQGFLDLRMTPWLRNLLTRSLAIVPSLIVSLIGGSSAAGKLIIIASMILSFELPFALVPLLKFTSSKTKMGPHTNSRFISVLTWAIGSFIMVINIYFLITSFVRLLLHSGLSTVSQVFSGIFGFLGMLIYIAAILYLVFRKNRKCTLPLLESDAEPGAAGRAEGEGSLGHLPREDISSMQLPHQRPGSDLD